MLDKPMTGLSKLLGAAETRSATALAPDATAATEEDSIGSLFADLLEGQPQLPPDQESGELLPSSNTTSVEMGEVGMDPRGTFAPDPTVLSPDEVRSEIATVAAQMPLLGPDVGRPMADARAPSREVSIDRQPLTGRGLSRMPDSLTTEAAVDPADLSAVADEAAPKRVPSTAAAAPSVMAVEPKQAAAIPATQAPVAAQISEMTAPPNVGRHPNEVRALPAKASVQVNQLELGAGQKADPATSTATNEGAATSETRMPVASPTSLPKAAIELPAASQPEFKLEPSPLAASNPLASSNASVGIGPAMAPLHTTSVGASLSTAPILDTTSAQWSDDFVLELAPRLGQGESGQRLRMQLAPEIMGGIELELKQNGDGLELRIVAETIATRALLDDNQGLLRERFAAQGLNLLSCECSLADERRSRETDAGGRPRDESQPQDDENPTPSARHPTTVPQLLDLYA